MSVLTALQEEGFEYDLEGRTQPLIRSASEVSNNTVSCNILTASHYLKVWT